MDIAGMDWADKIVELLYSQEVAIGEHPVFFSPDQVRKAIHAVDGVDALKALRALRIIR